MKLSLKGPSSLGINLGKGEEKAQITLRKRENGAESVLVGRVLDYSGLLTKFLLNLLTFFSTMTGTEKLRKED